MARSETDAAKVRRFMTALGRAARSPGRVYLTGGASAVLVGWRSTTIDVDLKFDPEPEGVFDVLPRLKDELDINVELAAPDDFIPALQGWRERSRSIAAHGPVEFFHYDFCAQALAKIERGHAKDVLDIRAMLARGLVTPESIRSHHARIEPALNRYPAIDPDAFREKVDEALRKLEEGGTAGGS